MFSPFAGLLFDPTRVPSVGDATSPPYDVISPDDREDLLARSPYNVVRLLLAAPGDPTYQQAADLLQTWRDEERLVLDSTERFYLYLMDYDAPDGSRRTARGVLGALDLVDIGDRVVGHEETMAKHRADRLAVVTATEANLDVIIALSSAPDLAPLLEPTGDPRLDFITPDGVHHRLHDVTDPQRIAEISARVDAHPVAIADGHHRYTTYLGYRKTRDERDGAGPWGAILALVSPAEGSGLTVGPYHRLFREFPFDPNRVADVLADAFVVEPGPPAVPAVAGSLTIATATGAWLLTPRDEALAVLPAPWREASPAVARELLYPRLGIGEDSASYIADAAEAVAAAAGLPDGAALLVAPVSEHAIAEAGETGIPFPQKTTYFIPKPRAGLTIRVFDA
jgi:uncharacterized protein (DUF1015 family)